MKILRNEQFEKIPQNPVSPFLLILTRPNGSCVGFSLLKKRVQVSCGQESATRDAK
jgi:hypothetical protein